MQVRDTQDKEILYIQRGNFKASSYAAVESSRRQEGLIGFGIPMLGEDCEDPLWFKLCFCAGESTKYCLPPLAQGIGS